MLQRKLLLVEKIAVDIAGQKTAQGKPREKSAGGKKRGAEDIGSRSRDAAAHWAEHRRVDSHGQKAEAQADKWRLNRKDIGEENRECDEYAGKYQRFCVETAQKEHLH